MVAITIPSRNYTLKIISARKFSKYPNIKADEQRERGSQLLLPCPILSVENFTCTIALAAILNYNLHTSSNIYSNTRAHKLDAQLGGGEWLHASAPYNSREGSAKVTSLRAVRVAVRVAMRVAMRVVAVQGG